MKKYTHLFPFSTGNSSGTIGGIVKVESDNIILGLSEFDNKIKEHKSVQEYMITAHIVLDNSK